MTSLLNLLKHSCVALIFALFCSASLQAQTATGGYAGGDLSYQMGNGDTIIVTLNYYIDCGGGAPGTSPVLIIRNCSGTPIGFHSMGTATITNISNTTQSTNCGSGSVAGRRKYSYTSSIDISAQLGTACNFYRLTVSPNTRNTSRNLSSSTSQRMWLQADLYVQNDATNSSPVFGGTPIPYVCRTSSVSYSPQVSDVDGDSLVFSLTTTRGGTANATNLTYSSGSGTAPIAGISIDATSGILNFTSPTDSGNYQVVVAVSEYDRSSGNQLSRTYRDFQFHIDSTCVNDGPVPAAAFSSLTNVNSTTGNDTVVLDTAVAASFRLLFTDANGINSYSSNAIAVLGGNATFNTSNSQISWTPDGDDIGIHIVTISAVDNVTPVSGKGAHKIVVVVQPSNQPLLLLGSNETNVTCLNPLNGALTVLFSGGTGPFSFQIEGQFTATDITQTTPVFTGIPSDNYKITIVDSGTGADTSELAFTHSIFSFPFAISSITVLDEVSCDGVCDGRLRVNPNSFGAGGLTNYTYLWDDGQTTRTAPGLCGGTRSITVSDTAGCILNGSAALFESPTLFTIVDSTDSASCNGAADGAAYLSGHGGRGASISTSKYIIDQTEGSFEPYPYGKPGNVAAANYATVTLGDDAVSSSLNIGFSFEFFGTTYTQFKISSNGFITLGTTNTDNGCCSGETLPDNSASPQTVIAAYWEDLNPTLGGTIETYKMGSGANEVRIINFIGIPHHPGGNEVTFQIALYETSNIIQIFGDSLPSDGGIHTQGIENTAGDTAFFVTGRNGANWNAVDDYVAFIPISQTFTYSWSSIGSGASATNLTAGTYSVIVSDAASCSDTVSFVIEEPDPIVIDTTLTLPTCQGGNNGQIAVTATGGDGGPYTFAWNTGGTGTPLASLTAGTYTVTATDASGCTEAMTITLDDPNAVTVSFTVDGVDCFGGNDGQITAAGAGGTGTMTYAWSNGGSTATITGLTAATYTVTATDANGCTATNQTTINAATAITIVTSTDTVSCFGGNDGAATATASGGSGTFTYTWNAGSGATISGLTAGTYTVTATDGNGCTATTTATVIQPASSVSVTATGTGPGCFGGSNGTATGTGSGGTGTITYVWNAGTGATISGLTAGTYTVTATDANGCTATDDVTITAPNQLFAFTSVVDQPTCNTSADGEIQAFGFQGTPNYTYAWSNGGTTQSITGLTAGTYTVTITDANGCTDTEDETLTAPNAITLTTDTNSESCSGAADGEGWVIPTGGTGTLTFSWNTGSTNDTIFNLTAGTYSVTVTDANLCTETASLTITSGSGANVSVTGTPPLCNGGSTGAVASTASGSGTLTYAWSNGATTANITGLTAATYTVTVTDANGCTDEASTTIADPTLLSVTCTPGAPSCAGGANGTASASASGGTGAYTFAWSNGGSGSPITGLTANTYTVTVTDANGCTATNTATVTDPAALVATASPLLYETCATNDGQATVTVTNAQGTPTFSWTTGATSQTITGLSASTYTVTVTDGNGCTDTGSVAILDTCACAITAAISINSGITCVGDSASITASGTGGSGTYTFLWPGGETSATVLLPAGSYCVTVDDGSCDDTACITLVDPAGIAFSAFTNVSEVSCDDACDGAGTANASGGAGSINYVWSSGANTASASSLCGGSYTVTATDGNGCTNTAIFALVEPPSIWAAVDSTDSATCGGADGAGYVSAHGGFANSTTTSTYIIDTSEGEYEPYGIGQPLNANSYEVVTLADDALGDTIEIFDGGSFSFFGSAETHFVVCSQGFITFDATNINSGQVNGIFSGTSAIPSAGANTPKEFIAGFWTDLDPSFGAAQIETYEIGTAPNRARVVNFIDVTHFAAGGNDDTNTFQIVLYENSNIIQIHSTQLRHDGGNAVQGIENQAGTLAYSVAGRNNAIFNADNDYVAFIPATQNFSYAWSSIGTGASSTVLTAGSYTVTVDDGNSCTDIVNFDIFELPSTVEANLTVDAGVSCSGTTNTGALSIAPSGGASPYTQLWSNAATGTSISNLAAGTYTVTVTDNNGCMDTAQVTLSAINSSIPSPTILTNDTSICAGTDLLLEGQNNSSNTFSVTSNFQCTTTQGGVVVVVFSNVPPTAVGNGTLSVTGLGNLAGNFRTIAITDENSGNIGTFNGATVNCDTSVQSFTLTQANINNWAANNTVSFVFDASFFVGFLGANCSGNTYCVQATFSFPTAPDTAYWFADPLNLDPNLAIGFGDTVTVSPTTSTSFYYANYNGLCWSQPDTINVNILPAIVPAIAINSTIACPGDSASVTASATGGSGSYNFTWPTGETTATVNLPAGTWCVTVDDGGGTCSDTACVILIDPTGLTVDADSNNIACNGGNNGTATATASGGTGTITYSWSNGASSAVITGLTAGTYTVTVSDGSGCEAVDSTEVLEPTPFVLNMSSNDVACNGGSTGQACASISGGTPNYTYSWSDGSTTACGVNLAAGLYTVTITDANGCTISDTISVSEPPVLLVVIDSTDSVNCFNGADGIAYASASGGTGNYTFSWPNGSTVDTSMNLTAGTYIVTVTDDSGCVANATATVLQPATGMTVAITSSDSASCFGGNDGAATALASNAQGTVTYAWSNGDTGPSTTSGLTAGTYQVTSTDASGCTATTSVIIGQPTAITVTLGTVTPIPCNGGTGGACVSASGGTLGYTYSWSNGANGICVTGLIAGNYTVTVTDANGCQATPFPVNMTQPTLVDVVASGTNILCNGANNGTATATASGGTGTIGFVWTTGATSATIGPLTAGTYYVTATDGNGCTDVDSFTVTEPIILTANIDSTDTIECFGAADGIAYASATGGTGAYTFAWPNGSTADTSMNLTAGSYVVTITDANGCTDQATAVIIQPATGMTISIVNTDSVNCNGGNDGLAEALAINGTGTITYLWSNGDNTAMTTSGLTAGTYGVTATDGSGCTASTTATIFEPAGMSVVASGNNPSCNGEDDGDAAATVTNGVGTLTYVWSNGATGTPITGLTADTYTVTVTDANGCTATDDVTLSNPAGMSAAFNGIVESSCTSCTGQATVTITGGAATITYLWPNGQTGTSATLLCDGINAVTVTDGNGCVDSFNVVVPADGADTVIAMGTAPLCADSCNGTVFTSNTCVGCTFIWIDSASNVTVGTTDTVTGLCAGTYIVEMTNTGNCSSFDTVKIVDPAGVLAAIPSSTDVTCFGGNDGSATATGSGGNGTITFAWSNGQTGANATGLTAGTYTVTASDANGCGDTAEVVIGQPTTGLSVVASATQHVTCSGGNNGAASAVASGGSGTLTYTWNGSLNGSNISGLTAGIYTVVVSDGGSCSATDTTEILEPTPVVVVLDSTDNPTCPGNADGEATVHGTGGSGTYTYAWPSGNTGTTETGLADGTYCVTVTDAVGCEDILCVNIVDPTGMSVTYAGVSNSSCTVCDGTAQAIVTGGNGTNYTYAWSNGQTTDTNNVLCAGVNNITITDSLGCTLQDFVLIDADGADTVFADSIDASCGACDGLAYATYNCNNGPCTVSWTAFGSTTVLGTTDTIDTLCAGVYFVELTNNGGCVSVDQVTVNAPDPIDPNETITPASCGGSNDGSIALATTGGSGTYSYTWSNGGNTNTIAGLTAGTYTVTISDNAGCDSIAEFDITEPTGIALNETITGTSCFGICDGSVSLAPSGGAGSYSYNWDPIPGNGQGVQAATGLCGGDYIVTVSDINGCSTIDTFNITQPNEIVQDTATVTDATCGDCNGIIDATISGGAGGFSYLWTNGDNTNVSDTLCFGFYELTVTDANGCFEVFGYPVSETGGPDISLTGINTSASGQCDGEATVTVNSSLGTVTFVWSNGDTTATADTLCAGLYIVTATDSNGCSTVDTITIYEPDALGIDFDVVDATCEGGGCDGALTANVIGGVAPYSYLWSTGDTTQTIDTLCGGTYVVTVTDINGTIIIDSATIDSPSPFTIVSTVTEIECPNSCNGVISLVITGNGLPSILWSTGDTTAMIDSLCPGTYTVIVSDTSGCNDSLTFELLSPPDLVITLDSMTEPDCQLANGSISVTGSGGNGGSYSYNWLDFAFDPIFPNQTTSTAVNLFAGIYNVVVSDVNGCSDTFGIILNNNNAADIALDSIVNVSCFGECDGAIMVTLSGGTTPYTIQWSSGGTMEDDSNLCAGIDTIAVADSNLCLSFGIYEVLEPSELILESLDVTGVICGSACDGEITANISGGSEPYVVTWSNGATGVTATDLCAGVYGVTITDANGCSVSSSANVSGPTAMVVTLDSTNDATCEYTGDGNVYVTVTGGSPGYSYRWSNGSTDTLRGQDLTNVVSGTYVLTLTDANGCVVMDTFDIGALFFVNVSINEEDFEVCPESRGVPVTGKDSLATAVRWLNAAGIVQSNGKNAFVDVLDSTVMYVFEGTNGICISRDTIYISETDGPGIYAGEDRSIEPGDEVTIGGDPTARDGVVVTWTPNIDITSTTVMNPMVNPLKTTIYYVSGIDGDECYGVDSVKITVEKIIDPVGGFSPNGDGVNDFFVIDRIANFPNAVVTIVNRWGNVIYVSPAGYTKPWNGTYKGNALTVGTYYYIIDLKDAVVKEPISGAVSILK